MFVNEGASPHQCFLFSFSSFYGWIDDEVEQLFDGEDVDLPFAKELVDVGQVFAQKLERVWMIVLHGLRDVDDDGLALVVEQVELTLEQFKRVTCHLLRADPRKIYNSD
jgi:hypothetical protein